MKRSYELVAKNLFEAYRTGVPIEPPRITIPDLTLSEAYGIQQWQQRAFEAEGKSIAGRKIGLTSVAMQEQLGVDSPDFGFFTDDQLFYDGEHLNVSGFIAPKVEPELAFKINRDLGGNTTFEDAVEAIEATYLAVEIIDSRVRDWDIRLVDTVADNASCAAVVLSREPVDIAVTELPHVKVNMHVGEEQDFDGCGVAVMGHPINPLVWLAGVLADQGTPLKAGEIILTGSFCAAASVRAGDTVRADYGTYGNLEISFIKEEK